LLRVSITLQILGLTSILTCELLENDTGNSRFGFEQFIADGVIRLSNKQTDDLYISTISIIKMRGSKHSKYIHPFEVTSSGIVIHS
jgi:KaiC/GvpD/RAD55 family RecA-like ATPase